MGGANALAEPTVYYKGAGLSVSEVQASGQVLRSTFVGGIYEGQVFASAQPKVEFLLQSTALAEAIASGYPHAEFFGGGEAIREATWRGAVYKRSRVRPGITAVGEAIGYGELVNHIYAVGVPAIGFAKGIGTTWHVARSTVAGEALAIGEGIRILGVKQRAKVESLATATAYYQVGFSGIGLSEAYAMGDATVRVNEVLYHASNGTAIAEGLASLSHVSVYQPQRAVSEAVAQGQVQHTHGVKGRAVTECLGLGSALAGQTGVAWVHGEAAALGYGNPSKLAHVVGLAVGGSDSRADAYAHYAKKASGTAEGLALSRDNPVALYRAKGTADGIATAVPVAAILSAIVDAVVISGESLANGIGTRTAVVDHSPAMCEATAVGYNQINDLVHAPEFRTLVVEIQDRLLVVESEPRLIPV